MIKRYILNNDKSITIESNSAKWADWYQNFDRRLFCTTFNLNLKLFRGFLCLTFEEIIVSTIFLGIIDQNVNDVHPLIFETLIFVDGDSTIIESISYSSYEEAKQGHYLRVDAVKRMYQKKGIPLHALLINY